MDEDLDLYELLKNAVWNTGGTKKNFDELKERIDDYSKVTGSDPEAILLMVVDSVTTGLSAEQLMTQLSVNKENSGGWGR